MKKQWVNFALTGIIAVVFIGIILVNTYNLSRAKSVAKEYVSKQYSFDTECLGGEFSWLDPSQYYIYFQTNEHEHLRFTVRVQNDFQIDSVHTNHSGERRFGPDNYFQSKFQAKATTYIRELLASDKDLSDVLVYCHNTALYAYDVPAEVNDTDSLEKLLEKMDYSVVLYYKNLDKQSKNTAFSRAVNILRKNGIRKGISQG